ncbi:heterokaryon incompatibility protein-domain-containing protein [Apiospora saccharicola]
MSKRFRAEQTRSLYSKLPKNSSVARLVTVLPTVSRGLASNDGISSTSGLLTSAPLMVCEIDEFDVNDDTIQYVALSYSWKDADPNENVNIICNSTPVRISLHLYEALDRLRSDTEPVKVKIMREIYQSSIEVIVWLGESRVDDKLGPTSTEPGSLVERDVWGALHIVQLLASGQLALDIPAFRNLDEAGPIMRGFKAIAERSWWERVWVVQEVVVANKGRGATPQESTELPPRFHCLTSNQQEWSGGQGRPLVALQLLRKFRSRKASDPKDKVFALLGLVQYWGRSQPLSADYSHSIDSTFLGTMMMLISSTESLSVLAGSTGRACLQASKVPSWVIDWSFPEEENEYMRLKSLVLYSAGGNMQGSVRLHGGGLLESPAYWIGKVEHLGEVLSVQDATKNRRGESLIQVFWRTICGNVEYSLEQGLPQDDDDGGNSEDFRRASFHAESGWDQWRSTDKKHNRKTSRIGSHWLEVPGLTNNEKKRNAFNYALSCASGGRRFFVTEQGQVGIGPKSMKVGDDVFVLCGSQVPFVLRRSKRAPRACQGAIPETLFRRSQQRQYIAAGKDANEELLQTLKGEARICNQVHWPCYAIIGDAYVHGAMHEDQNIGCTHTTVFLT